MTDSTLPVQENILQMKPCTYTVSKGSQNNIFRDYLGLIPEHPETSGFHLTFLSYWTDFKI